MFFDHRVQAGRLLGLVVTIDDRFLDQSIEVRVVESHRASLVLPLLGFLHHRQTLATSPLPLCGIPAPVQDSEYDDEVAFHREVHGVGKAPKQRAADSSPEIRILKRASSDLVVGRAQLIEELQAQSPLLVLVPLVRRRDVEIDSRFGNNPMTQSTIRVRQTIEDIAGGARAAGISAILGKSLFSEIQVRLRHRNLVRPCGDAVPKGLQIADLFSLREGTEPLGLRKGR